MARRACIPAFPCLLPFPPEAAARPLGRLLLTASLDYPKQQVRKAITTHPMPTYYVQSHPAWPALLTRAPTPTIPPVPTGSGAFAPFPPPLPRPVRDSSTVSKGFAFFADPQGGTSSSERSRSLV